jgi:hypothetical protein
MSTAAVEQRGCCPPPEGALPGNRISAAVQQRVLCAGAPPAKSNRVVLQDRRVTEHDEKEAEAQRSSRIHSWSSVAVLVVLVGVCLLIQFVPVKKHHGGF